MRTTKTRLLSAAAAGIAILLATPAAAEWWDWAAPRVVDTDLVDVDRVRERERGEVVYRPDRGRERDDDRRGRDDDRDRDDRGRDRGRGGPPDRPGSEVPAFCRSGEGHPVFGMSWCYGDRSGPAFCRTGEGHPEFGLRWCAERGFLPGSAVWRPSDARDVVLDRRPYPRMDDGTFGERVLAEVLGAVVFGRLLSQRTVLGVDEGLEGRWYVPLEDSPARVLQVRAGELPLAEISDFDGDGRAEVVLLLDM